MFAEHLVVMHGGVCAGVLRALAEERRADRGGGRAVLRARAAHPAASQPERLRSDAVYSGLSLSLARTHLSLARTSRTAAAGANSPCVSVCSTGTCRRGRWARSTAPPTPPPTRAGPRPTSPALQSTVLPISPLSVSLPGSFRFIL